jgi:hypothetical protein
MLKKAKKYPYLADCLMRNLFSYLLGKEQKFNEQAITTPYQMNQ